mgnify:CR=1 FL=1
MVNYQKILIVDDDNNIAELISLYLTKECFETMIVGDGESALSAVDSFTPNLILLDLMLPGIDGYQVCREVRSKSNIPIIMLSAKGEIFDKVLGLELGADDYLVKPFSSVELKARVNAMLRRYCVYNGKKGTEREVISLPGLEIYADTEEVNKNGERVLLTDIEYRILLLLAENRKKTYTTQVFYVAVWNEPFLFSSNNTVMVHIRNLRKKLEDDPQNPRCIRNVWGKGYRID